MNIFIPTWLICIAYTLGVLFYLVLIVKDLIETVRSGYTDQGLIEQFLVSAGICILLIVPYIGYLRDVFF